ncbi:hypothetical protein [Amycolatopsis sp. NPDC051903]|uniref:hypothetical protein n=1 Tax=Amycolatopsis sp. NPDC051903 TaxID=3363936 RepID=UPI0037AF90C1
MTISTGVFGIPAVTEQHPVHTALVVEIRAEASAPAFTHRVRPRVQRLRSGLGSDPGEPIP